MEKWEEEFEDILKSKGINPQEKDNACILGRALGRAFALACLLSIGAGSMSGREIEDRKELFSKIIGDSIVKALREEEEERSNT